MFNSAPPPWKRKQPINLLLDTMTNWDFTKESLIMTVKYTNVKWKYLWSLIWNSLCLQPREWYLLLKSSNNVCLIDNMFARVQVYNLFACVQLSNVSIIWEQEDKTKWQPIIIWNNRWTLSEHKQPTELYFLERYHSIYYNN